MKLVDNTEKCWGIKPINTKEGVEIWAIDLNNTSKHLARMLVIYKNGVWERDEHFASKLTEQDYDPLENGMTYLDDGAVETSRDKTRKLEEAINKMSSFLSLPFMNTKNKEGSLKSSKKQNKSRRDKSLLEYSQIEAG